MSPIANRVESFQVLVPAGTSTASPQVTDVSFPDGDVQRVELDVPAGHTGHTGIRILAARGSFIPYTNGAYLIADDHDFGWDVIGVIDTGSFQVQAYNTDVYDHTFYLRFSVLDFAYSTEQAPVTPLAPPPALV